MTNILPKKKWHVRTKDNIERVRRDEAQAAEEERERERKSKLAEQEARTSLLRSKARERLGDYSGGKEQDTQSKELETETKDKEKDNSGFEGGGSIESLTGPTGHVNFFQNLEDGEKLSKGNEENAAEKKREQDEWEKKIGYSVALGQDTEELTGEKVWWRKLPDRGAGEESELSPAKTDVGSKLKNFLDPINDVKRFLRCDNDKLTLKKHVKLEVKQEMKAVKRKRSSSPDDHSSSKKKRKKEKPKKEKNKKHKKEQKRHDIKSKKKKRKHSSSDSSDSSSEDEVKRKKQKQNLEKLRKERLEREKKERKRAIKLLNGEDSEEEKKKKAAPSLKQAYSSQFNPNIAKQNKLDANTKYWLQ